MKWFRNVADSLMVEAKKPPPPPPVGNRVNFHKTIKNTLNNLIEIDGVSESFRRGKTRWCLMESCGLRFGVQYNCRWRRMKRFGTVRLRVLKTLQKPRVLQICLSYLFFNIYSMKAYVLFLVTPGNPQRCNSMIAEWSIQLNFYVGLFTWGVLALVNTVFENCQK